MTATARKLIEGPPQYSEAWFALRMYDPERTERPVVFGASEAAACCNLSPYSSALQVYLEKRGEYKQEFTPEQEFRMRMGHRLEPVILDCYEESTDCILQRDARMYFHPEWSFMAASHDAIAIFNGDRQERSVDAKSTNWRMVDRTGANEHRFGESGTDQVPLSFVLQGQVQMAVIGVEKCDFPVLVDGSDLRIYTVDRNDDLILQIASAQRELVERIIAGDPPEPNWEHSGTVKLLHKMHPVSVGKVVELTEGDADAWTKKEKLSADLKQLEGEIDKIKAHMMWALGDAQVGRFPDSPFEIRRTVIADSYFTEDDALEVARKIGQVKRAGHSRLASKRIG